MEIKDSSQYLLSQIRDYQNKIQSSRIENFRTPEIPEAKSRNNFSDNLTQALNQTLNSVNELQGIALSAQQEYQMGGDIPLTDVVMKMQKASLAMEATIQIRNKILTAYQDIMNMPV